MEFCQNCDNYLYIKEDPEQRKIFNYCKFCDYQKERTEYFVIVIICTTNISPYQKYT